MDTPEAKRIKDLVINFQKGKTKVQESKRNYWLKKQREKADRANAKILKG